MSTTRITGGGSPEAIPDRVNGEIEVKRLDRVTTTTWTTGGASVEYEKTTSRITKGPVGLDWQ